MTLTVPEAARRSGRNEETIRRWIRSGRLRSHRVGTQHLVSADDLDAVLGQGQVELPAHWRRADQAAVMPEWEQLVRDGRRSH